MSNLNLQKLHEWVWPWPWTFKTKNKTKTRRHSAKWSNLNITVTTTTPTNTTTPTTTRYNKKKGGRRKSCFEEGGKSNSWRCCLCNNVIAIVSYHVHKRNDGTTDRTTNILISSNVHYAHLSRHKNITPMEQQKVIFNIDTIISAAILFCYCNWQHESVNRWRLFQSKLANSHHNSEPLSKYVKLSH